MGQTAIYRSTPPIGQEDQTCCWAACLEWWAKAANKGNHEQWMLIEDYDSLWDNGGDGTISRQGMLQIVGDPRWGMNHRALPTSQLTYEVLRGFLRKGPVYTGFRSRRVQGNHVNVIWRLSRDENTRNNPRLGVMEPAHRRLDQGGYQGAHVTKHLNDFKAGTEVILASPR